MGAGLACNWVISVWTLPQLGVPHWARIFWLPPELAYDIYIIVIVMFVQTHPIAVIPVDPNTSEHLHPRTGHKARKSSLWGSVSCVGPVLWKPSHRRLGSL